MVTKLVSLFFKPPPMPPIELPFPLEHVPGVKVAIGKAFELAYYQGVYEGLVAGVLVTLLFVPSLRRQVSQGAGHVASYL